MIQHGTCNKVQSWWKLNTRGVLGENMERDFCLISNVTNSHQENKLLRQVKVTEIADTKNHLDGEEWLINYKFTFLCKTAWQKCFNVNISILENNSPVHEVYYLQQTHAWIVSERSHGAAFLIICLAAKRTFESRTLPHSIKVKYSSAWLHISKWHRG